MTRRPWLSLLPTPAIGLVQLRPEKHYCYVADKIRPFCQHLA
jgi:hypothetical protein